MLVVLLVLLLAKNIAIMQIIAGSLKSQDQAIACSHTIKTITIPNIRYLCRIHSSTSQQGQHSKQA